MASRITLIKSYRNKETLRLLSLQEVADLIRSEECGSGFMYTYRGDKRVRIDYIFHDKGLKGLSYYKKELSYSDHYPVFMHIATKQE